LRWKRHFWQEKYAYPLLGRWRGWEEFALLKAAGAIIGITTDETVTAFLSISLPVAVIVLIVTS
jgi:hypothetical protein